MEKTLKCLSFALLALGLSAPAFAADCCSSNVLVPSQHAGFKVGIDPLYLRLDTNGLDYATLLLVDQSNFTLGFEHNQVVDPGYNWGFYAQVGYLFPCTGNDLTVGYTHLNSDNTNGVIAQTPIDPPPVGNLPANNSIIVLPLSALGGSVNDPLLFAAAAGRSEFTLNVVDLEAGQRFTTGAYDLRMFAGLRYANIDTTLKTFAHPFQAVDPEDDPNTDIFGFQRFHNQFRGIGPRIGVDARYCLRSGFGLDANLSTSFLAGTVDTHYNASLTNSVIPATTNFTSRNGSNSRLIPVVEARLGGDYTYIMDCRCKSVLVLEAGYEVTSYFNACNNQARVLSTSGSGLLSPGDTNDLIFDGPYLGVKYYA